MRMVLQALVRRLVKGRHGHIECQEAIPTNIPKRSSCAFVSFQLSRLLRRLKTKLPQKQLSAAVPRWCLFGVLLCSIGLGTGCTRAKKQQAREFNEARQIVIEGDYAAGVERLKVFLQKNPKSVDASRAGLFLFKAYLAQGEFENAAKWCSWTIQEHPNSLEAHKCQYKLAMLTMLQGKQDEASKRFGELADLSKGPYSAEATAMRRFFSDYRIEPIKP